MLRTMAKEGWRRVLKIVLVEVLGGTRMNWTVHPKPLRSFIHHPLSLLSVFQVFQDSRFRIERIEHLVGVVHQSAKHTCGDT